MTKVRTLTVGKMAFTTNGSQGVVVKVEGDDVTLSSLFGDVTMKLDDVYHSRVTAWGAQRAN